MRMQTTINAPAEAVWPFVADPVLMSAWNEKIIEVECDHAGPASLGETYGITYVMSGRKVAAECEVILCAPPSEFAVRCKLMQQPGRHVDECYNLTERGGHTRLTQFIDLRHSGIPRWALWIMRFIQGAGTAQGAPYLEVLQRTVEEMETHRAAA